MQSNCNILNLILSSLCEGSLILHSSTDAQFLRCLWNTLGLQLSATEAELLIQKYDLRRNGRVNYKLFCDEIDRHFNPKQLQADPKSQIVMAPEL